MPYKFKHWVDIVTQPHLSLRPPAPGAPTQGLLKAGKALLVSARGGVYTPGTPLEPADFVTPYIRRWLALLGVAELAVVNIEGTGLSEAATQEARRPRCRRCWHWHRRSEIPRQVCGRAGPSPDPSAPGQQAR